MFCVGWCVRHTFWLPWPGFLTCSGATGVNISEGSSLPLGLVESGRRGSMGRFGEVQPPCL